MTTINWREWLTDPEKDGFLSFSHISHEDHTKRFSDTVNNTGVCLMGAYVSDEMSKDELREILKAGYYNRLLPDGQVERYPGAREIISKHEYGDIVVRPRDKELNPDQLQGIVPLMREVGMEEEADHLVKRYCKWVFPHQYDHFHGTDSWLGRQAEVIDSYTDWWSNNESSHVNNLQRLVWGSFLGCKNERAIHVLRKKIDIYKSVVIFGARRPGFGDGVSKEKRKIMNDENICEALSMWDIEHIVTA